MKPRIHLLFLFFVPLLSACVTTIEGGKPKVDKKAMLESHIKLGMAYLQQDQRDSALRSFDAALKTDNGSAEAHQGMALIHQRNGETELAEKSFQRALRGRSDFSMAEVQYTYGRFLVEQKRYEDAITYFDLASQDFTYRRRANALFNIGLCSDRLGDDARALGAYQHALNLNSRFAPAALELAHKRFAQKDYAEAKRFLDMYAKNSRQSARSLWLGIRIERIFGNKDKEASYALALKNLHPYSQEFLLYKNSLNSPDGAAVTPSP